MKILVFFFQKKLACEYNSVTLKLSFFFSFFFFSLNLLSLRFDIFIKFKIICDTIEWCIVIENLLKSKGGYSCTKKASVFNKLATFERTGIFCRVFSAI